MESISGQCLLGACAAGANDDAWREFLRRYRKGLESGVHRGLLRASWHAHRDDVEDLLQEIYCRLLEDGGRRLRATRGTTDGEIGSYLRRLAENLVLDRLRASRAAKREGSSVRSISGLEDALADPAMSKEDALVLRERALGVLRVCRGASTGSGRNAWIAQKALLEGWSSREIARALAGAISSGAVDAVVSRVYRRLRHAGFVMPRRRSSHRGRGCRSASPGSRAAG